MAPSGIHQVTPLPGHGRDDDPVVTVDLFTPYKEIDRLLAEHKISGCRC